MAGIIGKKIGMTHVFDAERRSIACTLVEAGPCTVTQLKSMERDGYEAVQLGYGERKEKRTSKAMQGHFAKTGTSPKQVLKEFVEWGDEYPVEEGKEVNIDLFAEGDFVDVKAKSKGRGFLGVVKRHGFRGVGGQTHGQHNRGRAPGSLGACSTPSRVFKGMKMAGKTGNKTVLVENLRIMKVIPEKNLLVVSGSVPGRRGAYVFIEK